MFMTYSLKSGAKLIFFTDMNKYFPFFLQKISNLQSAAYKKGTFYAIKHKECPFCVIELNPYEIIRMQVDDVPGEDYNPYYRLKPSTGILPP